MEKKGAEQIALLQEPVSIDDIVFFPRRNNSMERILRRFAERGQERQP
jgi:hypothetical protein